MYIDEQLKFKLGINNSMTFISSRLLLKILDKMTKSGILSRRVHEHDWVIPDSGHFFSTPFPRALMSLVDLFGVIMDPPKDAG